MVRRLKLAIAVFLWVLISAVCFIASFAAEAGAVTAPTVAVTGNLSTLFGTAAASQRVVYQYGMIQSVGGSIIPGGSACSTFTDASGNLPTTGDCTTFVQGACAFVTIGKGQPVEIQFPYSTTIDLSTLILANLDPPQLVSQIALAGPYSVGVVVTNPLVGQVGTSTITWPICPVVPIANASFSLDTSTGLCETVSLGANSSITPVNLINGQSETVYVEENGTGGFTPTWVAPGGDTLLWVGQSSGSTQPFMPTTAAFSVTKWTFTLVGSMVFGSLDAASGTTSQTGPVNTVLTGQGTNVAPTFSAVPTLGTNGGTGGKITLNGSTSGSAAVSVAAAAGSPANILLPTTTGAAGSALMTDGGTPQQTSWATSSSFPAGTGLFFGGGFSIATSAPSSSQVAVGMIASRNLTFDSCLATEGALGSCGTFPVVQIFDVTASNIICQFQGTSGPGQGAASVLHAGITSGDVVEVLMSTPPVSCNAGPNIISLGGVYH